MFKKKLGQTGIEISGLVFGGMGLSKESRPSEVDSIKLMHHIWDAGINFMDTADSYGANDDEAGHNERLIKKALDSYGNKTGITVATKSGFIRPNGNWVTNGHPKHIKQACERSLKNLGLEQIALYQLHAMDSDVPYADSIGAFVELKEEGKIAHIGVSNVNSDLLKEAIKLTRVESVQNRFNPFCLRDIGNGVMDICKKKELTYFAYSPLCGGQGHIKIASEPTLTELASELEMSPYQVALAWEVSCFDRVVPIFGSSRFESSDDCLGAAKHKLSDEILEKLNEHFLSD